MKLDWLLNDDHRLKYTGFSDARIVDRTTFVWDATTGAVGGTLIGRLDIFNVVDSDAELEVDEFFESLRGGPSPTFGLPRRFQQPRTARIGLLYEF